MKDIVFTLLLFCATFTWAQGSEPFCEVHSFSLAPAEVQVTVSDFGWSTDKDRTQAHLILKNDSPTRSVIGVLILAEAVDSGGHHLSTVPLYAATKKQLDNVGPVSSAGAMLMQAPLLPGESIPLGATITETTARCAANIQPTLIEIAFSDGKTFHYSAKRWKIDPSLGKADQLDFSSFPGEIPRQEIVDVTVDTSRRITKVKCQTQDPQITNWFEQQLSKWSIFPEIQNGVPRTSNVKLLFRFHRVFDKQDPTSFGKAAFESSSIIPIDVFPKNGPRSLNQAIFAGGLLLVPAQ